MGCDLRAPLIQAKAVQEATDDYFTLPLLELLILEVKKKKAKSSISAPWPLQLQAQGPCNPLEAFIWCWCSM